MRQFFLILAATGCAYQDDDTWDAVDKACADAAWTAEGWADDTLPEPLASDTACQQVLAKQTGADALGDAAAPTRDRIVWSAWTLAFAPMAGPAPGDTGSGPALAWTEGGQPAVYEGVVQRLSEAEAVTKQRHELTDGLWGAVEDLPDHAAMLPLMVHESGHWRRKGHDPCTDGGDGPCDPTYDSPTGWEAAVTALLYQGLVDAGDRTGLAGEMGSHAVLAGDRVQEAQGFDTPDEGDPGDDPVEGIE